MKKPLITVQQNTAVSLRMPSFLTAGWGITRGAWQRLPCNASELFLFIINYAPYSFHRHKKDIGTEVSCSSTLYYYLVYKAAAWGKSHGRSQAELPAMPACSQSYWDFFHCGGAQLLLLCISPGHSLGQTPGQAGKSAAEKSKQSEMFAVRRRQHLCAKYSTSMGARRAHTRLSLIQNPAASNRGLHFAPTQKQLLKSQPCYSLLQAFPALAWLSEVGSSTYWSVLKWALCNGTDPRKLG